MKQPAAALVALVLLVFPGTVSARAWGGGFGYFGPMVAMTDVDGFNEVFARNGFGKLDQLHWLMAGGGYALINRVIIGGSGAGGAQVVASSSTRCRVEMGGGQFELGYAPLVTRHLFIGAALGIGAWGYTVTLEPTSGDEQNLDSLLARPGRTSQVSASRVTMTPELIIHVPISFAGIQLKAGYLFSPTTPEWNLADGNKLLSGPKLSNGTLFANLNVAFGGMDKGRRRARKDK
ncbi:hypothetical protein FJY69_07275 [candidate division WOR-3 bacterium]|nr:hypothetical protein [candidate division WOR-3 bacterium]